MSLPNGSAGVPTPGVDPIQLELDGFADLAAGFTWVGLSADDKATLLTAMGPITL